MGSCTTSTWKTRKHKRRNREPEPTLAPGKPNSAQNASPQFRQFSNPKNCAETWLKIKKKRRNFQPIQMVAA
jgi:hypothetical protein